MSSSTFHLDPAKAFAAINAMHEAGIGPTAIAGEAWAQGAMATLLRAEFLAAQAGVVPWFEDPTTGVKGILNVGAARERIEHATEAVRTMYLGTHALVRRTHATAAEWKGSAPVLGMLEEAEELGAPVLVIALVVVAIAGIVATAWYFTHQTTIEVEGRNLRSTAIAFDLLELARLQYEKTGQIDPKLYETFGELAKSERTSSSLEWPLILVASAVTVGAGLFAYRTWREHQAMIRAYVEDAQEQITRIRGGQS